MIISNAMNWIFFVSHRTGVSPKWALTLEYQRTTMIRDRICSWMSNARSVRNENISLIYHDQWARNYFLEPLTESATNIMSKIKFEMSLKIKGKQIKFSFIIWNNNNDLHWTRWPSVVVEPSVVEDPDWAATNAMNFKHRNTCRKRILLVGHTNNTSYTSD